MSKKNDLADRILDLVVAFVTALILIASILDLAVATSTLSGPLGVCGQAPELLVCSK